MSPQPTPPPAASPSLSERLQTVTETLAAARTQDDVYAVVLTPALQALDAVAGAVLLVDETETHLNLAATQGYEEGAQTVWQDGPLDGNVPAGDALERRQPLFYEQQGELAQAYPELEARTGGVAAVATAVLPMSLDDRPLGAVILDFKEPHHFTSEEILFLRTLAAQCALALGRVQATRRLEQRVEERTRELEAERNFLRTLLSSLGESIVACDESGRLTLFNEVSREVHGQEAEPVPPETWAERYGLYQPDGVTPLAPAQVPLYRAWQGQLVENAEIVIRHASGEARTVLVNGRPILSERGERLGAVVAQRDITERQEQARDLAAARTRAEVLAALGDALQRAGSPEEVAALTLARIGPAVGARGMLVVRLEGDTLRLPTVWGEVPEVITSYLGRPGRTLSDTTTFQQVARSGQAVYLSDYRPQRGTAPAFPAQAAGVEPIRSPDGTLLGFLLASRPVEAGEWQDGERDLLRRAAATLGLALERAVATRRLEEERAALDAFISYKEAVGGESDVPTLARQAVQVVRTNLDHVSAAYYELEGGLWKARVWSEDIPPEVVAQITAGVPQDAPNYAEATRMEAPLFVDGWDAAANGVPSGTSYGAAAFLPLLTGGEARSLFSVGTREARTWTQREKALVRAVARGLSVTLERTGHLRQLGEERAALDAFVAFTEASAGTTDVRALARRAVDVLRATLGEVSVAYSDLEGGRWKARVWSDDHTPEVVEVITAGIPVDAPSYAEALETRGAVFVPAWEAGREAVARTEAYGAGALYPCFVGELPRGLLAMGTRRARDWSAREQAVFRLVGRSLTLALERAEAARHLEAQNAELEARSRALEAFAELSRDLSLQGDLHALIGRAGEVALSLLPQGCVLFYEPAGDRWRATVQVGAPLDPALQAAVDTGLPFGQTHNLLTPWTSGHPVYQDLYDQGTDHLGDLARGVGATATLPLTVGRERMGVLAVVLSRPHVWSATDRAVLETTVRQLGLALEGARAQRELSRTQHYLRVAAENAPILLFATDARGVFTLSEGRLLDLLGLEPGQAVGHSATALFAHEPELREGRRLNQALAGREAHDLMHFSSRNVTLETWFVPVRDAAGEVTEVVGVSLDVTERLEAQRQIERANEELRRSNAELEQFAYVASHDLQAPIRAVTSFAGVIDRRYGSQLDERGRLYLRQIVEGGEHMKRLVDDLLTFSRVHTEQRDLSPVDSGAVFDVVARRLSTEAPGASITRGELPVVLADAQQLDQLLQNLLGNGLKYRRKDVVPKVHVWAEREGQAWRFAVSDNGIGIEPQYFGRIFVIFQRLHGREEYEGTGIGLAVCKKIVERHGGRLWLESTPGAGSTFLFTLPQG